MACRRIVVATLITVLLANRQRICLGRSWRDTPVDHIHQPIDTSLLMYMQQQDALYKSQVDENTSILSRTRSPETERDSTPSTIAPSPSPSVHPTTSPTGTPTISPSEIPIVSPSSFPTATPTVDPCKDHEAPENPDPWYFNYDVTPLEIGDAALVQKTNGFFEVNMQQNRWGSVSIPPNHYWNEFNDLGSGTWRHILQIHEPSTNQCANGRMQSPIDVRENGGICHERHQIRSRPGNSQGNNIEKRIESNKLRLIYERRRCSNVTLPVCQDPDPPHADFPYGWGGFADLLHIDIKVPSEHTILNERFDAEMQIYHLHPGRRRVAALSVLIRATYDGYNYYFDEAIKAFKIEYNKNIAKCTRRRQREEKLNKHHSRFLQVDANPIPNFLEWAKNNTKANRPNGEIFDASANFDDETWNPYHELLIPTIHFYRYEGSLTEPPCGEFVSWWISDTPMIISVDQLEQLKIILFTNVDENCQKTGVQHHQSVARPIQSTNNRRVWKCSSADFGPDLELN